MVLIELLVTLAVLGVLAYVGYRATHRATTTAEIIAPLSNIVTKLEDHVDVHGALVEAHDEAIAVAQDLKAASVQEIADAKAKAEAIKTTFGL